MSRNKKNKKKTGKSAVKIIFNTVIITVVLALFCVMVYLVRGIGAQYTTQIARSGTLEDTVSVNGYIIRSQTLVYSSVGGTLEANVLEGEKVYKGQKVASVYKGNVDSDVLESLRQVNEKIRKANVNPYKKSIYANDTVAIEKQIGSQVDLLVSAIYRQDGEKIFEVKNEINQSINKKNIAMGIAVKADDTLDKLVAEKAAIEARNNIQKSDLYAPAAGVFVSFTDGMEEDLVTDKIPNLRPSDLDEFDKKKITYNNEIVPERAACKIVDNFEWYFVAAVETKDLYSLKQGDNIALRFFDVTDTPISGRVAYISQDEGGRSVVAVAANEYVESVYSMSRVTVDVIKSAYKGIKVPKTAIHFNDKNESGVFVLKDNMMKFKPITVLYNNKDWSIVKEENDVADRVLLYDEVIVSGKNLEDGKIIR